MRARRSTPRSSSSPTSSEPRDTSPPSTGVPPSPAGYHTCVETCGAASVGPAAARARPVRMLKAHAHEAARVRCPLPRLPDSVDSAPAARRNACAMQLALAIVTCERAASPVLLTACELLPRRRQPQLRAVGLDGHRTLSTSPPRPAGATSTPRSQEDPAAWPSLREASVPVKTVPVSRAWTSSRLRPRRRTARPAHHRVRRRRLRPGHRRLDHRGIVEA
jgi:hypothetical protein